MEIFAKSYTRLSSCRSIGMGIGPIWNTAIEDWCDRRDYEGELRDWAIDVIMLVDAETLRRANAK